MVPSRLNQIGRSALAVAESRPLGLPWIIFSEILTVFNSLFLVKGRSKKAYMARTIATAVEAEEPIPRSAGIWLSISNNNP